MKKIIVLLTAALFILGNFISVMAADSGETNIEQKKEIIINDIDQMIKLLQDEKVCVAAARTKDEIKKCHEPIVAHKKETKKKIKDSRRKGTTGPFGAEQSK